MPFSYPQTPHARRHGPRGYQQYQGFKPWLRDECKFRCAYCLVREKWHQDGSDIFGIDHIFPKSLDPSRECDYSNLAYACNRCNRFKSDEAQALDPIAENLGDHMAVNNDGTIEAKTSQGRRIINLFRLDSDKNTEFRAKLLDLAHTHSGKKQFRAWMGFPNDIPDLRRLIPPKGNDKPDGVEDCYFVQRERGLLPDTY